MAASRAALFHLLITAVALLVVPLGIRAANRLHPAASLQPTYLPAIEGPRERAPFEADRVPALAGMQPTWVVIGDSIAGSRIDPALLARLTGGVTAPLLWAGSGTAWWYLALKNWVIPSRIRPRAVIVFFRDTNLTNVLFRIDATWALDTAAHDREDELNAVVARRRGTGLYGIRERVDRLYGAPEARRWLSFPTGGSAPRSWSSSTTGSAWRTCVRWTPPTCRPPRIARRTSTPSWTSRRCR